MKEEKILLIDGNSYIHRAFHALPPLTDAAGRPVNAIYGFLRMLKKLITDEEPSHIFVAFDHKSPTFRHRDFAGYKAHRPETDKDLSEQFERLFSVLDALNIKHADYEGYEADDIIGSFTQASSDSAIKTIIVTGDKDILQLLREDVIILNGMTDKVYTATNLSDLFGVDPEYVTDYLALVGDRSDNLPGVRGVGAVTAKKLIDEYGGLENIYDQLTEIGGAVATRLENGREDAFTTRHLVTLVKDLDLPYEIEELRWEGPDARALRQEFQNLNFRKLISDWIPADELQVSLKREIILTEAELSSFLSRYDGGGFVIEICFLKDDSVLGIGLGINKDTAAYIPLTHLYLGAPQQLEENLLISQIGDFLGKNDLSVDSYDFKRVYRYFRERGEVISPSFDLFTADYLLSPSSAGGSLAEIAGRYLDWLPPEYTGKESEEEVEKISMMASSRVAAIMEMKDSMEERLKVEELLDLYLEIERPMAKILAEMELEGIGIDIEGFEETARAFRKELRKIEEKIFSIAGTNFNINSPAQLSEILFEKRGLKPLRKTKKGFSTAEDVLQKLSKFDPLPEHVLDYRHYQKLNSTYVEPLPKMADNDRGRLHTSFNIAGTATGRLSSSEPNLQNIPVRSKEGGLIRKSFIPSPNSVFLSADYSQIDLRVLAHLSGDEGLRESFIKGEDIHRATAARVFDLDEKEVTDEMRKRAKAVNFGIVYGISGWGLSKNIDMSPKESEEFIKKYFERYPGIKDYMDKTLEGAKEKGYVKTILGRTRRFPEIKSKNYIRRGLAERAAINTPVQGSSADIIKKAMVELDAKFSFNFSELKLILQIHDELLFEVAQDKVDAYIPQLKNIMENSITLSVPLKVDFSKGYNLRDLESC